MLEQFLNHIRQYQLCSFTDRILLAVSGGRDSMAMLHLFKEAGFKIGVAHVNFQLRGDDSMGDEEFVKDACRAFDIPFHITRVNTETYAQQHGLSIQMAARALRYSWFDELLVEHHYKYLATAHHLNDSIETVLLHLIKGSSLDGLTGIPLSNGNRIRPLLFATQIQIEKYVADHSILWREDRSNLTDDYQRNFIRHKIVPLLKEINPSLENTFKAGQQKLKGQAEMMALGLSSLKKDSVQTNGHQIRIQKKGLEAVKNKASVLLQIIKEYNFNLDQAINIIQAMNGQSGKRFLSNSHQLVVDREYLIVSLFLESMEVVIIDTDQTSAHLEPLMLTMTRVSGFDLKRDQTEALLDASSLEFPLTWRKWKPGDYFYPLGMEHKRKVSDFLIDEKISVADKNSVTVIESAGQICWVVGYRIDNRFKITPKTTSTILFSLKA